MSNGGAGDGPCPECAKVILNGGIAARVLDETCESVYDFLEHGGKFDKTTLAQLVVKANEIEDLVFRFQRAVLEGQGFNGPWPHSLTFS